MLYAQTLGSNYSNLIAMNKTTLAILWSKKFSGVELHTYNVSEPLGNDANNISLSFRGSTTQAIQLNIPLDGSGLASSYTNGTQTVTIAAATSTLSGSYNLLSGQSIYGFMTNVANNAGMSTTGTNVYTQSNVALTDTYIAI